MGLNRKLLRAYIKPAVVSLYESICAHLGRQAVTYQELKAIASRDYPKYRCHKNVRAVKIKSIVLHDPTGTGLEDDNGIPIDLPTLKFAGGFVFPEEPGYAPIEFSADFYRKHKPKEGGYFVMYDDGYISYSPAKAFEGGYTRIS